MKLNLYVTLLSLLFILSTASAQLHINPTQAFVNRDHAITPFEAFGVTRDAGAGGIFGGMYVETTNQVLGRPFYGYAVDNVVKSYTYYDNADNGLHTYLLGNRQSIWKDSMEWITHDGDLMRFHGYKLTLGKNGNAIVGYSTVFNDSPNNIGNSVFGALAAQELTSGVSNTILGSWSAWKMTTGDFNTLLGTYSGADLVSGSKNTMVGYYAGSNSGTNSTGNVFLGYRAGDYEQGSNKLYIANSQTTTPLIYGDFSTADVKIHGNTEIEEALTVNASTVLNGSTTINQQLTSQDINIDDFNPYLQFKHDNSPKYYMQYQSAGDQFVLVEVGKGTVLKIKDGDVYLPELAGGGTHTLRVDNTGKITTDLPSPLRYSGIDFYSRGPDNYVWKYINDLENGMTINSMEMLVRCASNPVGEITFGRVSKTSGYGQAIFQFNPPGNGCDTFSTSTVVTPGSNVIDTDTYVYFFYTDETDNSYYSEVNLHH